MEILFGLLFGGFFGLVWAGIAMVSSFDGSLGAVKTIAVIGACFGVYGLYEIFGDYPGGPAMALGGALVVVPVCIWRISLKE